MQKKEIIAMLLAGGQGSRLGILTKTLAKPAVLYGGKYRIIDFSLSNCINSGIDTVGILTQYQPLKLNSHIGIGKPWDLDRASGGITILSPYLSEDAGEWYKGTANAICQNIHYIDAHNPEYVIILSGDHIYKMDYSLMLDFHKKNAADATISVIEVPYEEANRFGIMNTHDNGKIYEFQEKPKKPKSNLASMGVYIFTWKVIREYLIKDNVDPKSSYDFGKNIIPAMLQEGRSMWAYKYHGYWKDVGTIEAYWESNMDLIAVVPEFNLFDPSWKTYTQNHVEPAHYIGPNGSVKKSLVAEGCVVYGNVKNSVIFPGVKIGEGTLIEDSIIMSNCEIGNDTIIRKTIIGEKSCIGSNIKIGEGENIFNELKPDIYNYGITVIGESVTIPQNAIIGKNVVIDNMVGLENFCSLEVPSGKSVLKGGECS